LKKVNQYDGGPTAEWTSVGLTIQSKHLIHERAGMLRADPKSDSDSQELQISWKIFQRPELSKKDFDVSEPTRIRKYGVRKKSWKDS
jgi:hypothetical protein